MAMEKCKACGGEVGELAETCPHCGRELPKVGGSAKAAVLTIVLLAGFGALIWAGNRSNEAAYPGANASMPVATPSAAPTTNAPDATPTAATQQPSILVSAQQLFADYSANEVAADNQYKGQSLKVIGIVAAIAKDFRQVISVRLATPNEFEPIEGELGDGQENIAAALMKGQRIELDCQGDGMELGSVMLSGCMIAEPPAAEPKSQGHQHHKHKAPAIVYDKLPPGLSDIHPWPVQQ